jgi:hypothetical protein
MSLLHLPQDLLNFLPSLVQGHFVKIFVGLTVNNPTLFEFFDHVLSEGQEGVILVHLEYLLRCALALPEAGKAPQRSVLATAFLLFPLPLSLTFHPMYRIIIIKVFLHIRLALRNNIQLLSNKLFNLLLSFPSLLQLLSNIDLLFIKKFSMQISSNLQIFLKCIQVSMSKIGCVSFNKEEMFGKRQLIDSLFFFRWER